MMTRARSLRLSIADPPMGSNAHGSEGMLPRARRRRPLAESSESLARKKKKKKKKAHDPDPQDWRDWANNLLPELVDEISGRLLSVDVTEYRRFRAVCSRWRDLTADPRTTPLDSRFRPRNWAVLTITPRRARSSRPRRPRPRRLLNLSTAASLGVDIPALASHCHMCAADGLLVLLDRDSTAIRLVDPLSNAVTDFPAVSCVFDAAATASSSSARADSVAKVFQKRWGINLRVINGACFDDSTSPPTLVLCLRYMVSNIIVAKPGDAHWTLVSPGEASYPEYDAAGKVLFYSLLSHGGRCYLTSPEGSVYMLELQPLPRLVEVVDQRTLCAPDTHHLRRVLSFLVHDGNGDGRMLMVRYWVNIKFFGGREAYEQSELFTVDGITGRIEVLELDLAGRRLVPVRSLGRHAVFAGETHCVLVSTETFPSLGADTVYLGYRNQRIVKFSTYDLNSRGTEPPHQFRLDEYYRLLPCARPCNLDQYLACYVDRAHGLSSDCIGHSSHENDLY